MLKPFDVIVIGGGHSGCEAATAAARQSASVLLITSNLETIGQMSCNPAIGGIAKGTVVREVDALGGIMGRAADQATIQFRMLNQSKGPAVWAPRAQCDRGLYRRAARQLLETRPTLAIIQSTVTSLMIHSDHVDGVITGDGQQIRGQSVVVTAGTFLRGRIHRGAGVGVSAGRAGDPAALEIAEQLQSLGLEVARFKTGTPPRIDGRTVDFSRLERQDGASGRYRFSHFEMAERPRQVPCWITWAGPEVKEIIQTHLHESALYGGAISGRGPRYCPSIEDKVVKFPKAERHQIFLEPEGLETQELYVNGLSTSLPTEVQRDFLHAVPGLEQARMTRAGYAIEYDYYPPQQLTPWLELKAIERLFFAGQVNGTTGYEEAAGQGVVAGINAVRRVRGREPVVLGRDAGYLGVLVDDLVTRGVDEPYRLFTSRSEYRLLLRQDNALKRLGPLGSELGLLSASEEEEFDRRLKEEERLIETASGVTLSPRLANPLLESVGESEIDHPQLLEVLARRPHVRLGDLFRAAGVPLEAGEDVRMSVEIELKYGGYLERERQAAKKLAELADFRLPVAMAYLELSTLSTEAREKLDRVRPESLAQASRIPGVSPADLQNLILEVIKRRRAA